MKQAPHTNIDDKIKAVIHTTVTPQQRPTRQRKTQPTPTQTVVIHGGHNIVAHHGAVVHWHQPTRHDQASA